MRGSDFCWKLALGDFEGGLIFTLSCRIENMYSFPIFFSIMVYPRRVSYHGSLSFLFHILPPSLASPAPLSPTALHWFLCWGLSWLGASHLLLWLTPQLLCIILDGKVRPLYPASSPGPSPHAGQSEAESPCWLTLPHRWRSEPEQKIGIGFTHCSKISLSI